MSAESISRVGVPCVRCLCPAWGLLQTGRVAGRDLVPTKSRTAGDEPIEPTQSTPYVLPVTASAWPCVASPCDGVRCCCSRLLLRPIRIGASAGLTERQTREERERKGGRRGVGVTQKRRTIAYMSVILLSVSLPPFFSWCLFQRSRSVGLSARRTDQQQQQQQGQQDGREATGRDGAHAAETGGDTPSKHTHSSHA